MIMKYLLFAAVVIAAYVYLTRKEGFFSDNKKTLVLYHLPRCGFCRQMMPAWQELEKAHKADPEVKVSKVNCEEHPEEAETNGINAFPTIILFHGGERKIYDGERTKAALEGFINRN